MSKGSPTRFGGCSFSFSLGVLLPCLGVLQLGSGVADSIFLGYLLRFSGLFQLGLGVADVVCLGA